MDRRLAEAIVAEVSTARAAGNGDEAVFAADLGDRTIEVVCAAGSTTVAIGLSPVGDAAVDADVAWAWLGATWLRRLHDGVVATADAEGRLGLGLLLPGRNLSADGAEQALALLDRASRPNPTAATDTPEHDASLVWIKI